METTTEDMGVGNFLRRRGGLATLLSAVVVIPCVWQRHIEAGDLGSHVYNAWLAELVEQGRVPGVYVVTAWKNVLFDLMLFYLGKIAGLGIAEKVAVGVCVLIFFWGVFALVAAVTGRMPWALMPAIAMLAYGYVFYMGFMNFYLSIGLASVALAVMWPGTKTRILWAVVLAPLILLAHPLGLLWLVGTAAYRLLWLKLDGRWRALLPVSVVAFSVGILVFFLRHPEYQADWDGQLFYMRNGTDQLAIYGRRFEVLSWVLLTFGVICAVVDPWTAAGRGREYWKERRLILELYFAAVCVTAGVPQNLRPDPNAGWIGVVATRLTVISAIFGLCWLASLRVRWWQLAGFAAAAILFFVFTFQETAQLNRLEENAEQITRELPFGTRVLVMAFPDASYRQMFIHAADRACVGHCFVYSNYEPSTKEFRLRVQAGSPVVTASVDDSEDMQSGT
ncbi:MAG: hypothetical protein WCE52_09360, partial [Candidatus Acidiferrum sp.]